MLSRREAIGLLGAGAGGGAASSGPQPRGPGARVPRGAVIRTLLKDVPPEAVNGSTLFHEHLSIRYPLTKALAEAQGRPVPVSFSDDVELMIEETKAAGADGVRCIVDGGHPDMDRDLAALKRIASESGVHIVASGGYYMQRNYPPDIATKTADQIADDLVRDATRSGSARSAKSASRAASSPTTSGRCSRRWRRRRRARGCRSSRTTRTAACASRTRRSRWTPR